VLILYIIIDFFAKRQNQAAPGLGMMTVVGLVEVGTELFHWVIKPSIPAYPKLSGHSAGYAFFPRAASLSGEVVD